MADERWQRTWELFHQALDVDPEARGRWLVEACRDDPQLRRAIEDLLAGHDHAPSFLDRPQELHTWLDLGDDLVGETIGVFQIEALVGEGGMGVVYRARQEQPLERTVALKLIQVGMATREVVARFAAERQVLAVLDHPNIAKVFDAGATEQGRPYFVMELVEGVAITRFCDQHRLSTRQRLELMMKVCRAAHHAHQKGIIHRDLKPSNVLVAEHDGGPVPKIIDFGVARAVDRQPGERPVLTQYGRLIGTPEYMSPEQAEMSQDVDIRTDVYSLGVLLYELLVGTLPGAAPEVGASVQDRLKQVVDGPGPQTPSARVSSLGAAAQALAEQRQTDPSSLRQQLRGDLDWIVMRALEKERARRYGSASELAADLERHLRDEPVLAGPPGVGYRFSKFVKRHRLGVAAAVLGVILLLVFTCVTFWQSVRLRQALEKSELEARKAEEVSTFLTGLFKISDPGEARGNSIAAREILDRGAQRIAGELGEQPEIQAAMMGTMGEIYIFLGLLPEAEALLEQSLQVGRGTLGEMHPSVADDHLRLSSLRQMQGDYPAAERQARRALEVFRKAFGEIHPKVALSLSHLGSVLMFDGRYGEAEETLRKSMALWKQVESPEHVSVGTTMNELGLTLKFLGKFEEAERVLRETIEIGRRTLGEDHHAVATRQLNLASVLGELGDDEEAERLLRESLETRRKVFGAEHIRVAMGMNNLARIVDRRGKPAEAEALFRAALEMRRRLQGDDHPEVAKTMVNLGVNLRKSGQYEAAESLYREALGIQQRVLGPDHETVAISHHNLASLLRRLNRLEEAEVEMRRAVEILLHALGDNHPHVARSQAALGKILNLAGRFEEAEFILRRAEVIQVESLPANHESTWVTRLSLGESLAGQGRYEEAESLLTETLAGLAKSRGASNTNTQEVIKSLVALYEEWNRPQQAAHFRAQVLDKAPAASP